MDIGKISNYSSTGYVSKSVDAGNTAQTKTAQTSSNDNDLKSSAVNPSLTISGKALMYSRLFNTSDTSISLEVVTEMGTVNADKGNVNNCLTEQDRAVVESAYEYASKNNIDLQHVDAFAWDLAVYRNTNWIPPGEIYTPDGRQITARLTDNDKKIADRTLASDEIKSTTLDRGFLDNVLGGTKPVHASKMEFLEHLVGVTSSSSSKIDPAKFTSFQPGPNPWIQEISSEVNPAFVIEEPDLIQIDGRGYIRNPKKEQLSNEEYKNSIDMNSIMKYFGGGDSGSITKTQLDSSKSQDATSLISKLLNMFIRQ